MTDLGIQLPDGFLEEEVRCGYTITRKMKEIWAVEMDLLAKLLSVCRKYDIKIFASGGTLLGAIRHSGMIPWDDDIDMMMFREDYGKLCAVAEKEFEFPYFFQTEYSDPGSLRGHAQLRNSNTTAIRSMEAGRGCKFNQGIFIDIFPLDNVIHDPVRFKIQYFIANTNRILAKKCSRITTRFDIKQNSLWKAAIKRILHNVFGDIILSGNFEMRFYQNFERECARYNYINTEMVSTLSFQFCNRQHFKYRSDFEEIIWVPFEFMQIPIGKNYDHALRQRYGEYMKLVKGVNCHGSVFYDTRVSYCKYIK